MRLGDWIYKCGIGRKSHHRLFVDEAGDTTLCDPALPPINGVSQFFMLGAVYLPYPESSHQLLSALRRRLKANAYLSPIPSMKRTEVAFHACKDADEIKYKVFRMLPQLNATVQIAIDRKSAMYNESLELEAKSSGRLTPNGGCRVGMGARSTFPNPPITGARARHQPSRCSERRSSATNTVLSHDPIVAAQSPSPKPLRPLPPVAHNITAATADSRKPPAFNRSDHSCSRWNSASRAAPGGVRLARRGR